jgi:hypothetical protein
MEAPHWSGESDHGTETAYSRDVRERAVTLVGWGQLGLGSIGARVARPDPCSMSGGEPALEDAVVDVLVQVGVELVDLRAQRLGVQVRRAGAVERGPLGGEVEGVLGAGHGVVSRSGCWQRSPTRVGGVGGGATVGGEGCTREERSR